MNHNLPCAIVRDLLPAYVEGLTEEETTLAVRSHLESCPDCTAHYQAMTAPEISADTDSQKEVDFLKTLRRRGRRTLILTTLSFLMLVLILGLSYQFLIGSPAGDTAFCHPRYQAEEQMLDLTCTEFSSGRVFAHWKVQTSEDGVLSVTARSVLPSPWYRSETEELSLSVAGIREVQVFGRTVWSQELVIASDTEALLRSATPYVGNPSALNHLDQVLTLSEYLPDVPHTYELETNQAPYGWTFCFSEPLNWKQEEQMEHAAPLLLALVGNLEEIHWVVPTPDGSTASRTCTLEEANAALPSLSKAYHAAYGTHRPPMDSVKDAVTDLAALQYFLDLLEFQGG